MQYHYVGEATNILACAKKDTEESDAKIKSDANKVFSNDKRYRNYCQKLSGVKNSFGIKCSICGR